jgi:tetratricopeptide (TPR) repeat protein
MKFDKTKAMRSAERFLTQGKYEDAVKEYANIVEHDPKDFTTLNTLGDLYIKTNSQDMAVGCFSRVADHYSKQGFAQKAIAVYKKVLKLEPNSIEISAKLAPLYQLKGSILEARDHYTIVANHYQATGKKVEALNIWKRVAELDPMNDAIYIKLAEGFLEENQREEACSAFVEAGLRAAKSNNLDIANRAFLGALEIKPNDFTAMKGYVNAQIKSGNVDDAVEYLHKIRQENTYNTDLLMLLADCYLEIDNPYEAEKTVIQIVEKEPIYYTRFIEVVNAYFQINDLDSCVRVLTMASEHLLVGGKAEEFKGIVDEILARNPELVEGLRLLVRYCDWLNDDAELKRSLERLAEASREAKNEEAEKYALQLLLKLAPHETQHSERLVELGEDASQIRELILSHTSQTVENNSEEVPQYETFASFEATADSQNAEGQNLESSMTDFEVASSTTEKTSDESIIVSEASEFEDATPELSPQLEMHLHQELESVDFYISNEYGELAGETLRVLEEQFGFHPEIESRKVKLGISSNPIVSDQINESEPSFDADSVSPNENIETTNLESYGRESDDELVSIETVGLGLSEPDAVGVDELIVEEKDPSNEIESDIDALSVFSDFREGLDLEEVASEPESGEDFETHYQTATAYKEMGLMDQAISEFQESIKHVGKTEKNRRLFQCYTMLGLCFSENQMPKQAIKWYDKCLKLADLGEDQKIAVRYEIAVAHQLEGNKDLAMHHFEEIYGTDVNYRDVGTRLYSLK